MSKPMKTTLKVFAIIISVLLIISLVIGNVFYALALDPTTDKSKVMNADQNSMEPDDIDEEVIDELKIKLAGIDDWMKNVAAEDVYMDSQDGLKLHAYSFVNETPTNNWIIVCHGYLSKARDMAYVAKEFYENGFNVLMPDARGHGESEGKYIGMGWDERIDITDWCYKIADSNENSQIVLYGVSMGGATVMMTSGEKLPTNVKAIVEDCGYTSVWDEFSHQLSGVFHMPDFPIMHVSSLVTKVRAGFWLSEANAIKQVEKSVTPMLFIHGDEDTFVPYEMMEEVYDAATCPKEKLIVEGAGHGMSGIVSDVYWDTVYGFIDKYI